MRRNRRHLAALIAAVFCLCAVFASFAAAEGVPTPDGHLQTDEDKLFEFWSQPAGGTGLKRTKINCLSSGRSRQAAQASNGRR